MKHEKYIHLTEASSSVGSQDHIQFVDVDERYSFEAILLRSHFVIADGQVIAFVIHDDQHLPHQGCWIVAVNGVELHRSNDWAQCCDYVKASYLNRTLPLNEASGAEKSQDALYFEALLDKPFDELTALEWQSLKQVKLVL